MADVNLTPSLGSLPSEIIQRIYYYASTPSFLQLSRVNRRFLAVAESSREAVLLHLAQLPGTKPSWRHELLATKQLFLLARQRAAEHLYGANITADCYNFTPSSESPYTFSASASCLYQGIEDECVDISIAFKNSLEVRLHNTMHEVKDRIDSPYADGEAKVIQAVQKRNTISVLYAWSPSSDTPDSVGKPLHVDAEPSLKGTSRYILTKEAQSAQFEEESRSIRARESRVRGPVEPASPPEDTFKTTYHLMHFNKYDNDRPVFFAIPVHVARPNQVLAPVHLAVHSRLKCAILWDVPGSLRPTMYACVLMYSIDRTPRNEIGYYNTRLVYPYDRMCPSRVCTDATVLKKALYGTLTWTESSAPLHCRSDGSSPEALESSKNLTRAISFFRDGRRLHFYGPGDVGPFAAVIANDAFKNSPRRPLRNWNRTTILGHTWLLSPPFYSGHQPNTQSAALECCNDLLCLATTTALPTDVDTQWRQQGEANVTGPKILCLVRVRQRLPHAVCSHMETIDDLPSLPPPRRGRRQDLTPLDSNQDGPGEVDSDDDIFDYNDVRPVDHRGLSLRVVGRLWGWEPLVTNMVSLDTISVSPKGTRIAVAQWDRVLVYALNPRALCDDSEDIDPRDQSSSASLHSSAASSDGSDGGENVVVENDPMIPPTHLPPPGGGTPVPIRKRSEESLKSTSPLRFYNHVEDDVLGSLVEFKPIVLKMDRGHIARKMIWSTSSHASRQEEKGNNDATNVVDPNAILSPSDQPRHNDTTNPKNLTVADDQQMASSHGSLPSVDISDLHPDQQIRQVTRPPGYNPKIVLVYPDRITPRPRVKSSTRNYSTSKSRSRSGSKSRSRSRLGDSSRNRSEHRDRSRNRSAPSSRSRSHANYPEPPSEEDEPGHDTESEEQNEIDMQEAIMADTRCRRGMENANDPPEGSTDLGHPNLQEKMGDDNINFQEENQETIKEAPEVNFQHPISPIPSSSSPGTSTSYVYEQISRAFRKPRCGEDELIVMTDHGVQVWDLSVWGRGTTTRYDLG